MRTMRLLPFLASALALAVSAALGASEAEDERLSGMERAAESPRLELYIDTGTAGIAVRDKASGTVWFSNPIDRESDPVANELNRSRLGSQLKVTVYTPRDQMLVFDSLSDAVRKNGFELERTGNGVTVLYEFDNLERGEADIPTAVEKERFETRFLGRMTDEERELFLSRYRYDEERNEYYRFTLPRFLVARFLEVLDRIGYTGRELELDTAAGTEREQAQADDIRSRIPGLRLTSGGGKDQVRFSIPIRYELEDDALTVTIETDRIEYDRSYPIHSIEPLEFFGAGGVSDEGYIFVPDGSGALIRLNNGKTMHQRFSLGVYGSQDVELRREELLRTRDISFPVFGIKTGERAVFAVIEEGDTIATINADVSGRLDSYNRVSAEFRVTEKGKVTLGTGTQARSKMIFQPGIYPGPIRIRYSFLTGEEADYVGMARCYQEYLVRQGALTALPPGVGSAFNLELIGSITDRRTFAGIPFPRTVTLTTFSQALDIVDELSSRGVHELNLRYSGWLSGGVRHLFPASAEVEKLLGGEPGFRSMSRYLAERNVALFPDLSVVNVYGEGGGFSVRRDAVQYLNQSVARVYQYDSATFQRDLERSAGYYLTPGRIPDALDRFTGFSGRLGIANLSFRDLASKLVADHDTGEPYSRRDAVRIVTEALASAKSGFGAVATEGVYAPYLAYTDIVHGLPFSSSRFNITDEDVPFNALVLHGFKRFTGEPLNLADDTRIAFLKAIETGADLSFLWTCESAARFKDTEFDRYYSSGYRTWIDRAVEMYQRANAASGSVVHERIVRHEQIRPGVYLVGYSGGTELLVNYTREPITAAGVTVNARDFAVLGAKR